MLPQNWDFIFILVLMVLVPTLLKTEQSTLCSNSCTTTRKSYSVAFNKTFQPTVHFFTTFVLG